MSMFFLFKQKTAYELRISDWRSDVCSSNLFSSNSTPSSAASINLRNTFVDTSVILWRLKSSTPIRSARVINDKEGKYFILFFPAYIRRIRQIGRAHV